jgi:hypothetical protein
MAEPPASGWAIRGAGFAASLEGVSGVLLLLPEEIGFWAFTGTGKELKRDEAARHRRSVRGRRVDDLVIKDTIGFRRSLEV